MKTILNTQHYGQMMQRLDRLQTAGERKWGRMTMEQMVCHLADQLRLALGEIEPKASDTFFSRHFIKRLVLYGMPAPPEKVSTVPEIDQANGMGTHPTTLEADLVTLKSLLNRIVDPEFLFRGGAHPFFGYLDRGEWGKLIYSHMQHHLKQFNV